MSNASLDALPVLGLDPYSVQLVMRRLAMRSLKGAVFMDYVRVGHSSSRPRRSVATVPPPVSSALDLDPMIAQSVRPTAFCALQMNAFNVGRSLATKTTQMAPVIVSKYAEMERQCNSSHVMTGTLHQGTDAPLNVKSRTALRVQVAQSMCLTNVWISCHQF